VREPRVTPLQQAQWEARGAVFTWHVEASSKTEHGRVERRELWALSDPELNSYVGSSGDVGKPWPHVRQICRVKRCRKLKDKVETEVSYAVTSIPPQRADAERLLRDQRSYWAIENRLHYVRDVTMGEDACRTRTGSGAQALATVRNLVVSLLRRAGFTNVAAGIRECAWCAQDAVALILPGHYG
jgi:predicted transposase YbfD/YdcC